MAASHFWRQPFFFWCVPADRRKAAETLINSGERFTRRRTPVTISRNFGEATIIGGGMRNVG